MMTTHTRDWFTAAAESAPDTPTLMVSGQRTLANVQRVAEATTLAGKRLRPHTKTHKMLELARWQLNSGADGLQVAKLGEAEVMLETRTPDLLVAYPIVGAAKMPRLNSLAARTRVTVSLDSLAVAKGISRGLDPGSGVDVLIEVDTGLSRVGVTPEQAAELAAAVAALPGLTVAGVLTHEGQVGRQLQHGGVLADLVSAAVAKMAAAVAGLRRIGVAEPMLSMGSTASWRQLLEHDEVGEVRPGLYVFHDMNSIRAGAATLAEVAAVVAATVVSVSRSRHEFVVDAGSKSIGSEARVLGELTSYGYLPEVDGHLVRVSEEHGVVAAAHTLPAVGDRLVVVPNHVCPVVNLYDAATVLSEDGTLAEWRVAARGLSR
jgi:D-serine deaminase-like pyridoxal phosphate-dependent protein